MTAIDPTNPLNVSWPFCGVPTGERCGTVRGRTTSDAPVKPHAQRRRKALATAFSTSAAERMELLARIGEGADIWGYTEAQQARQLEKLGLVRIVEPMADPPGNERQPYFGVVLTAAGRTTLRSLTTVKSEGDKC